MPEARSSSPRRPRPRRSASHFGSGKRKPPGNSARRATATPLAAPGESFRIGQIEPADLLLAVVAEARPPAAALVAPQAGDEIPADDRGAVDPDESRGIKLLLQLADRVVDQP